MIEFVIENIEYRASKLDALKQFHLSRKLAPVVPRLAPVFAKLSAGVNLKSDIAALGAVLGPFADAIADMSVEDSEFIIATCLSAVHRRQGDAWAPVWNSSAKALMFADMDLGAMLPIVVRVIRENLGNFIVGLLSSQSEALPAPTSNT